MAHLPTSKETLAALISYDPFEEERKHHIEAERLGDQAMKWARNATRLRRRIFILLLSLSLVAVAMALALGDSPMAEVGWSVMLALSGLALVFSFVVRPTNPDEAKSTAVKAHLKTVTCLLDDAEVDQLLQQVDHHPVLAPYVGSWLQGRRRLNVSDLRQVDDAVQAIMHERREMALSELYFSAQT